MQNSESNTLLQLSLNQCFVVILSLPASYIHYSSRPFAFFVTIGVASMIQQNRAVQHLSGCPWALSLPLLHCTTVHCTICPLSMCAPPHPLHHALLELPGHLGVGGAGNRSKRREREPGDWQQHVESSWRSGAWTRSLGAAD